MAQIVGTRIGLVTYTAGSDPRPGRAEHNAERQLLERVVVVGEQGTDAGRPTAGKGRALYWNTDRTVLQFDDGLGWQDVSTVGGGGPATDISVGGAASEGASQRGARSDHVHLLPLATGTTHGGMSAADKSKLDGATSAATAGRMMIRDANGRAQVASPLASADIANRGFVEGIVGGAAAPIVSADNNGLATPAMLAATTRVDGASVAASANTLPVRDASGRTQVATPSAQADATPKSYVDGQIAGHRHDAAHITTGTLSSARLPVVTSAANGAMTTSDKIKLDAATSAANANAIAMRSSSGTLEVATPSVAADAAPKSYVDAQVGTRAASSHGHDASAIQTGTVAAARLPLASTTTTGAIDGTTYSLIYAHNHSASAITSGTLDAARLPLVTPSVQGAMSATDKIKLDTFGSGSVAENASTVPVRTSGGQVRTADPSHLQDAATRNYCLNNYWLRSEATGGTVDAAGKLVLRGSDANFLVPSNPTHGQHPTPKDYVDGHTWPTTSIRSGVWNGDRIRYSSWAYNTAWGGSGTVKAVHVVSGSYELCFYSSTRKHKRNIRAWEAEPTALLAIEPVMFDRIDPETGLITHRGEVGVVAEQAGEHVPNFVEYDEPDADGTLDVTGWSYAQWTTGHQVLHRHHDRRDSLHERRLDRIEKHLGLPPIDEGMSDA